MSSRHVTQKALMLWLWAAFFGLLAFIVLVGGFVVLQKQAQARDAVRAAEAQQLLQKASEMVYAVSGEIFAQVEALRAAPNPEAWQQVLAQNYKMMPQEIAFYHADDSGADVMILADGGRYATSTEQFASRAVPHFQRALTLRAGEVYITPARNSITCDYTACRADTDNEIFAYVTPVYDGVVLRGALVVAYDANIWSHLAEEMSGLPETFFVIDAQGYYVWHANTDKRTERARHLPSSFFVDFSEDAAANILTPSGGRVVLLDDKKKAYMYPVSPSTEMTRNGARVNIPAPVTSPLNQYFVMGFIE